MTYNSKRIKYLFLLEHRETFQLPLKLNFYTKKKRKKKLLLGDSLYNARAEMHLIRFLHWNDWADDDAVYPADDVAVLARQGRPWTVRFML